MKKLLIFLSVTMLAISCKKDERSNTFCTDGTVIWGGDPAADGLGWYIKGADGKTYIPENLPDSYKTNNLAITTCLYVTGEKFQCQCAAPLDVYHITSISKK
jgi:hypothetical protein